MGTNAHLIAVPEGDADFARARTRLTELEHKWSRFLADSELSTLNRAEGAPVLVSPDTYDLVAEAVQAWSRTRGLFDPTVHDALVAAGYDRSFRELSDDGVVVAAPGPTPGCGAIDLDPVLGAVRLPVGIHLDLGGIGKGRAVDLVHDDLARAVDGVCVNLGGDLRVSGTPPPEGWLIGLDDPFDPGRSRGMIALDGGAVATSTCTKREWSQGGRRRHHLIDPRTGRPTEGEVVAVTVIAAEAMAAEILAKAALVAGAEAGEALLRDAGVAGELVLHDGRLVRSNGWTDYER
jgi:thiamine biosynthesis lipoprotein